MKNNITPALQEIIEKTVTSCGMELYDIEFKTKILRVMITHDQGITVDTCAKVSDAISTELDKQDLIPSRYFLEVSSPGIERKLRCQRDFEVSVGKEVSIRTRYGHLIGVILKTDNNGIEFKHSKGSLCKTNTVQYVEYKDINLARLVVTDEQLFNKTGKTRPVRNQLEEKNK